MKKPQNLYKAINPLNDFSKCSTISELMLEIRKAKFMEIKFPLIVRLVENPAYSLFGRNILILPGAVDEFVHDSIHLMLGRGFLPQDEAFVVGFTVGSTKKWGNLQMALYQFIATNLYPKRYKFSNFDMEIFIFAVELGAKYARCDLSKLKYSILADMRLSEIRQVMIKDFSLVLLGFQQEEERFGETVCTERLRKLNTAPLERFL